MWSCCVGLVIAALTGGVIDDPELGELAGGVRCGREERRADPVDVVWR